MNRILFLAPDAALSAVLLIPVFLLVNRKLIPDSRRCILCYIFSIYLCAVYSVAGLPHIAYVRLDFNINLVPFQYMFSDLGQSLLNVLLFLPLGFFLPVLWRRYCKLHRTLLFGLCLSLMIELLQLFTIRATDINDLLTNTLGTLLGWCIGKILLALFPSILPSKQTSQLYIACLVSFAVMFFLFPWISHCVLALYPIC